MTANSTLKKLDTTRPRPSEQIVINTYRAAPEMWRARWRTACTLQLAEAARKYITNIEPLSIDSAFDSLDHLCYRRSIVDTTLATQSIVSSLSQCTTFRTTLEAAFSSTTIDVPKKRIVSDLLQSLVAKSVATSAAQQVLAGIEASEIYCGISDLLASETYMIGDTSQDISEAELLVRGILTYYFRRWRMPCKLLRTTLRDLTKERLGLRGSALSIQNRFHENQQTDQFAIPVNTWPQVSLPSEVQDCSDLLRTVVDEASAIPGGSGFFHRVYPISNSIDPKLLAKSPRISETMARKSRHIAHLQYEYTAVMLIALAGIESLLRTHSPLNESGDLSLDEVIAASPNLPECVRAQLNQVFGTDRWNIRNRCYHGAFLEIESRRVEVALSSGIVADLGAPTLDLSGDGSRLDNVASVVLDLLSEVAGAVTTNGCTSSTKWVDHFLLADDELNFASSVHCDLLDSLETAKAWQSQIREYLRDVTPCLSIPLQDGLHSWFSMQSATDTLPGFAFLMLLFEPFVRLTLHMAGRSVLQTCMSCAGGRNHFRMQYKMLDSSGLVSQPNINWFTDHLSPPEKVVAARTLGLAVKCRDAFAHGAVAQLTEQVHSVYGHVVIKSIQLVVQRGMLHIEALESALEN